MGKNHNLANPKLQVLYFQQENYTNLLTNYQATWLFVIQFTYNHKQNPIIGAYLHEQIG